MQVKKATGTSWITFNNGKGILVDTGMKQSTRPILKKIESLKVDIPLIFLTHTHYDHTGSAETLRRATGAKIIVGREEGRFLRSGHTPVPKGTNAFTRVIGRAGHDIDAKKREHYDPVTQDVIEVDDALSLQPYGFEAEAVHLGAHSIGSIGLKIGNHFFAGDTVFGIGNVVYPPFADFEKNIMSAWKTIIASGAKYVYPGHGRRLSISYLIKKFEKRYGECRTKD